MTNLLILVAIFFVSSCASNLADRNKLDYKPASFGPVMDRDSLRYDFMNRSGR